MRSKRMRSKRRQSKKRKSKINKIRRKINKNRTKMKKTRSRKTRSRKTRSRKTRVNKRSRIRKTKRRMRGGSGQMGPLMAMTPEESEHYKAADRDLAQRKELIDGGAEKWFSENPNKLYNIALLDTLPEGPMKEYTKSVYNINNIRIIITHIEPTLAESTSTNIIGWLMDWVNRNPGKEPHFSENENRIIRYIKEYPRIRRAIKHGISYEKISDAIGGSDAFNVLNGLIVLAAAEKKGGGG